MPTVNLTYTDQAYTDFIASSPRTGIARVTNNGTFSIYIRAQTGPDAGRCWKVRFGATEDVPVFQGERYTVNVCGAVSVTYTLI